MSGPKRGYYRIQYDATSTRLADLERFSEKQERWLESHGEFLGRHLGQEGLEEAQLAVGAVQDCILAEDPDAGFDAYGEAWATLNRLQSEATEARDLARRLRERRRREQEQRHRQAREEAEARAAAAVVECRSLWADPDNQEAISRWASARDRQSLESSLESLRAATPKQTLWRVAAWQRRFQGLLDFALGAARENAKRLAEVVPRAQKDLSDLADLNLNVLTDEERGRIEGQRTQLAERIDAAIAEGASTTVEQVHRQARRFLSKTRKALEKAELRWAGQRWHGALRQLGYSVTEQQGNDGKTIRLQATAFPTRQLSLELNAGSRDVHLNVNGEYDSTHCGTDVTSLQQILAEEGIHFGMSDWGRGNPSTAAQTTSYVASTQGVQP